MSGALSGRSSGGEMGDLFHDGRLSRLYAYWWSKRGQAGTPNRADLDPSEIPDLLPIVHLIDVRWDPLRFRHRLIGTELVQRMERDVTGKDLDETLYGPATADILDRLGRVAAEVRGYRRRSRLDWQKRDWLAVEAVLLPLVGDDGRTAMILRGASIVPMPTDFEQWRDFSALPPL